MHHLISYFLGNTVWPLWPTPDHF